MVELTFRQYGGRVVSSAAAAIGNLAAACNPTQPDHPKYRPDIDGLRAIAVLSVIGFHAAPGRLPAGFIGVDIFFVISGYLITSIILKGLEAGTFSFSDFYGRRVKRIFPALLIVLLASLAIGCFVLLDDQFKELGKHVAGGAGFVSNFVLWGESGYFDNAADFKPLLHLWSLGIEEQFYIVWPFLLWLAWKRQFHYLVVILAVALASFALNIYKVGDESVAAFYSPLTRFWELLVGSTLAYISVFVTQASPIKNQGYLNIVSVAGLSLLAIAFFAIDRGHAFPGWWALLPTIGTAFVIWAGPNAWLNRIVLSNRILVWVGLISFPLYLWHWPLLSFLRILEGTEVAQWKRGVAIAIAILLAWATYRLVEKPVRHGTPGTTTPLFLALLMGIVGLVGGYGFFANGFEGRTATPRVVNAGEIGHFPFFDHISKRYFPCTPLDIQKDAGDWNGFVRCFQSKDGPIRNVALIGDSHAEHLFPGLAARLAESNVVFYGKGDLPFVSSREFDRIFETVLGDSNITVVLLSANWGAKLRNVPGDKWKHELGETITKLAGAGKLVYLIDDVPAFSFMPNRCKYDGRLGIENKCSEPDRDTGASYLPAFGAIAAENSSGSGSVNVIKIYNLFCQQGSCYMARDGVLHFRDEHHLNLTGSAVAANIIVEQIVTTSHGQTFAQGRKR